MKKTKPQRILALLLSILMLITALPTAVGAYTPGQQLGVTQHNLQFRWSVPATSPFYNYQGRFHKVTLHAEGVD